MRESRSSVMETESPTACESVHSVLLLRPWPAGSSPGRPLRRAECSPLGRCTPEARRRSMTHTTPRMPARDLLLLVERSLDPRERLLAILPIPPDEVVGDVVEDTPCSPARRRHEV